MSDEPSGPVSTRRPPVPSGVPGLILFDLDGTLTASGPGILASVRHALTTLGEPLPSHPQLEAFIGPPLLDSFGDICGLDHDRAWAAVAAYRDYYGRSGQYENRVYDGIPEALTSLAAAGCDLAVATSKAEPYAHSILGHFGLSERFTTVVGSELDGTRTAKVDVIAEVLRRLDRGPDDAVMVGDRAQDVRGAIAAGIPCVGALWGYGTRVELASAGAAVIATAPSDLPALILG